MASFNVIDIIYCFLSEYAFYIVQRLNFLDIRIDWSFVIDYTAYKLLTNHPSMSQLHAH